MITGVENQFELSSSQQVWAMYMTGIMEIKSPTRSYDILCPNGTISELLTLWLYFQKVYYRVEESEDESNAADLVHLNEISATQESFKASAPVEDDDPILINVKGSEAKETGQDKWLGSRGETEEGTSND